MHGAVLPNAAARPVPAVERHKHPPLGRKRLADGELFCGLAECFALSVSFNLTNVGDLMTYVPVTVSTNEIRPRILSHGSPASQTIPS